MEWRIKHLPLVDTSKTTRWRKHFNYKILHNKKLRKQNILLEQIQNWNMFEYSKDLKVKSLCTENPWRKKIPWRKLSIESAAIRNNSYEEHKTKSLTDTGSSYELNNSIILWNVILKSKQTLPKVSYNSNYDLSE